MSSPCPPDQDEGDGGGDEDNLGARLRRALGIHLLWVSAPLLAIAVRVGLQAISPHDYWWPIVQARAAEQLGQTPETNLFLYTVAAEAPFFNQPWLAERLMWSWAELHDHHYGVMLCALCMIVAFAALMRSARRHGATARVAAAVAMVAVVFASNAMSVRTQMFAVPCFALTLGALWRLYAPPPQQQAERPASRHGEQAAPLGLLLLAVPCWANLHGSFVLAPLLAAALGLGALLDQAGDRSGQRRMFGRGALLTLATALLCSLTPHGPRVFLYAYELTTSMGANAAQISEWAPMGRDAEGFVFYLGALVSAAMTWWLKRQVGWRGVMVMALTLALALKSRRHLIWWAMSSQLVLSIGLSAWFKARRTPRPEERDDAAPRWGEAALNALLGVLLWGAALSCLPGGVAFEVLTDTSAKLERGEPLEASDHLPEGGTWRGENDDPERGAHLGWSVLNSEHPLGLLSEMRRRGYGEPPHRLFHTQSIGGLVEYMLAHEAPRQVAFVDQRFELIPAPVWRDYFVITAFEPGWEELVERYDIGVFLIDEREDSALADGLHRDERWCMVEQELTFVWYERCASALR